MALRPALAETAWERGRLDARRGPSQLLFGRMHEDCGIELSAFRPGGRVFCIASAGCTAMALSQRHEVVAADINAAQVAYVRERLAGAPARPGTAERLMALARAMAPLAGWRRPLLSEFLELAEPAAQVDFWRRRLETRRLQAGMDLLLSRGLLRIVYAKSFLVGLPPRFGAIMRARMERCFARHPNRENPYARALLLGDLSDSRPPATSARIELVHADAAEFLEGERPATFDGFTLSNILDGASEAYRTRLGAAVRRAAAPGAIVVRRSFREPGGHLPGNLAGEDRSMLWGSVEAAPAEAL